MAPEDPALTPSTLGTPSDSATRQVRDRLVSALLDAPRDGGPRFVLLECQPEVALLITPDLSLRLLLLTIAPQATPAALGEWFAAILKHNDVDGPELHIIAVGGADEVADTLRKAIPPRRRSASLWVHHLSASGTLERLGTRELPQVAAALARDDVPPLSPERLAAALAEGHALQQTSVRVAAGLGGSVRATATITAVCVVLMALELLWMGDNPISVYAAMGANSGPAVRDGEVWRLFASAFLHGGILHLLVNMLALWSFGPLLESLLGVRRYVLLYGLSALGGALASAFLGSGVWSVGASGAIWGLMAAGYGVAYQPRDLLPPGMVEQLRKRSWMPLLVNIGYSLQPGIDILAHLGGGAVGFALIAGLLTRDLKPLAERDDPTVAEKRPRPGLTAAAVAVVLAMALSVAVALIKGRPWELDAPLVYQRTAIADTGFTAELPGRIADRMTVEQQGDVRSYVFGRIPDSPVAFEFIPFALPQEAGPADVEAILEAERATADQVSPPEFTRTAPARRVTIGGRPAVLVEHALNDLKLSTYILVFPRHELLMRRYALGEPPSAWAGAEETIAASLAPP